MHMVAGMGRGVWVQTPTLGLGLLPAHRTSPLCDSISLNDKEENQRRVKRSEHPPPSVNADMALEGEAGGRQGSGMLLVGCGRLGFWRTQHVLTTSPQQSLPKPLIYTCPGGIHLCSIRGKICRELPL